MKTLAKKLMALVLCLTMALGLLGVTSAGAVQSAPKAEESASKVIYATDSKTTYVPAGYTYVYQSTDDAGEFTYLLFRDDTMASTYHIEFRYGSDLDQLLKYFTGPYAYWLSAGIDENADAQTIDNVIDLFVTENLSGE